MIILSLTVALEPALPPPLLRLASLLAGEVEVLSPGLCNSNFSIEMVPLGQPT